MNDYSYQIPHADRPAIRWRMAEAAAWCATRDVVADPANALRTPSLRPDALLVTKESNADGTFTYSCANREARAAIVRQVAERRVMALANAGIAVPMLPADRTLGRLLVCDIDLSTWEGLSPGECGDFLDGFDIPAWDCWIDLQCGPNGDLLLSWVPVPMVPMLQSAMQVNSTSCLWWADHIDLQY